MIKAIDIIKKELKKRKMAIAELAREIRFSEGSFNEILNGKKNLTPNVMNKVSSALDISLSTTCVHCGQKYHSKKN